MCDDSVGERTGKLGSAWNRRDPSTVHKQQRRGAGPGIIPSVESSLAVLKSEIARKA